MRRTFRIAHDVLHIAILPFAFLLMFALVDERVEGIVESVDIYVHLTFALFAAEGFIGWLRHRRHDAAHHAK